MTSGVCHRLGVDMGEGSFGPRNVGLGAHYEDLDFLHLNVRILKAAGGDWMDPPGLHRIFDAEVEHNFTSEMLKLTKTRYQKAIWGIKDPRMSLLLPLYEDVLPNIKVIICYRKFSEIADSLLRRNGFSVGFSYKLAMQYYKEIIRNVRPETPVYRSDYDSMCDDPAGSIKKLVSFLGVRPSKDRFLEAVNYPCRRTH